ncbi:MAG: response regulator, partial [Lachnospiraceae bacterium]|nr:response regulator [Lachnospiraceae bacterium]
YGMTQEYLKTIFDAFTRAENSITNKVQGTGLGMAITKNIVELMGGTIDVTSEVNQGSLFRVELELRIPEEQKYKRFWEERKIARVLVVSGNAESGKNIQMLMKDVGVIVHTAFDREEAMCLIADCGSQKEGYGAVLLDWDTPEINVVHIAKEVRETLPETVPILFLTAEGLEGTEDVFKMKNTDVLSKPFFVSAFQEKISELQAQQDGEGIPEPVENDNLEGMHFLAAEDNEINAEILREILSIESSECEIVENGKLAVERFEAAAEGEFDAILMDVQMPVMNGYEATKAIRELKRKDAKEIPIIAMTANAFAEDEKEALAAGMNIHLAKPIDIALLRKVIQQCVIRKE